MGLVMKAFGGGKLLSIIVQAFKDEKFRSFGYHIAGA